MRDRYSIYILTNDRHTVLYTGVTNNLQRRISEHRAGFSSFTSRYNVHKLVYFEEFHEVNDAIAREKQIKGGSRQKKVALIDGTNPDWRDLSIVDRSAVAEAIESGAKQSRLLLGAPETAEIASSLRSSQ
jgi:putative endonuclease